MRQLIAIAYEEQTTAAQAAEELKRRADDLSLDPDAIGVIVCERDGSYQLGATHHPPSATVAWSKFWGILFGVLVGEIESSAMDAKFRDRIADLLTPGSSILFAVVEMRPEAVLEALTQYGGTPLKCSLGRDGMAELWATLDGEQARS